jgi:hypothetical protein
MNYLKTLKMKIFSANPRILPWMNLTQVGGDQVSLIQVVCCSSPSVCCFQCCKRDPFTGLLTSLSKISSPPFFSPLNLFLASIIAKGTEKSLIHPFFSPLIPFCVYRIPNHLSPYPSPSSPYPSPSLSLSFFAKKTKKGMSILSSS